ncbi:hypothetical protein FBU59_003908 [Linderina macrospora]|uniref:Uncharacterized protein n=1 Tax=Linderina macrospora TaxID=4868 RepID=A0ACC1J771_9FUNG|nr:hypothetical protein FBU59_003908 [Linderina macrospora]
MLSQSESGPASMPVGAATSVLSPDSNDGSETEPQAFVQQSLDLDSVGVTYRPEMVGESALAMFIGMAVKHSTLEDIMPVVELWAAAVGNSLHMSAHGCRRELSERTVAKILALLRHSPTEQSEHIADRFLAFVEDNFPESMPL